MIFHQILLKRFKNIIAFDGYYCMYGGMSGVVLINMMFQLRPEALHIRGGSRNSRGVVRVLFQRSKKPSWGLWI